MRLPFDLCMISFYTHRLWTLNACALCLCFGGPLDTGFEIFSVRRFYVKLRTMVDCLQDRALLLLLTELSGPRLESGFFVTSDSPGLLALFWDLLCSPARQLVLVWWGDFCYIEYTTNSDGRHQLLCCYCDLAPRARSVATCS